MKKLLLTLPVLLAAGSLMAAPQKAPARHTAPAPAKHAATASTKMVDLKAEVVSVDTKTNMLTFKADGKTSSLKVDSVASHELSTLKAGQQINLTVRESSTGMREAITRIKAAK